jgi:exopolysaccharide biosynthesis polyprenyl glycosylphosphotransferase
MQRKISIPAIAARLGLTRPAAPAEPSRRQGELHLDETSSPASRPAAGVGHFPLSKKIFDRIGAFIGILLTAPVMLAVAIIVKLESRGPVFYTQTRCGLCGRPFRMHKIRTMYIDSEQKRIELLDRNEMSGPVFKLRNDPRVTPVGRFLRRHSIDELPQFFNVLRGDMSLVGPRPPLPQEASRFEPWQERKLSVKPGITCLWQVSGRNRIDFDEWMRLDLEYIDHRSLWLDLKIIGRTIPTVLRGTGM